MNIMNNEYMVRTLSAFVNSALNKCSLSLNDSVGLYHLHPDLVSGK